MANKPAIFEMSPDTRLLRQRLARMGKGETITYAELSAEISKEVTGGFSALQSARRSLLNDEGFVFSPVRGEGLKRLNDSEIVAASDGDIVALRRRSKRAARKLSSAEFDALTEEEKLQHTAKASVLGAVAAMTTEKAVTAVSKVAQGRANELPIRDTLKAMGYAA